MKENNELKRLNEMKNILLKYDLTKGITPDKVVNILEELGPTFIKLGQILSTRIDLIPKEYCEALSKLRGNTKKLEKEEVIDILKNNYEEMNEVFSSIDECIGSASIAQVHLATLTNGKKVVVKVCRPNVYEQMELDVQLSKKVVRLLHLNHLIKAVDLSSMLDEMLAVSKEESNLLIELDHLVKFKELNSGEEGIDVPFVYQEFCTKQVLVMEYIKGIKINDISRLKEKGYSLEEISYLLSNHYMKQALVDGFFHADPHPDNLIVRKDKITYLDLGMVGVLSSNDRALLKRCIRSIVDEDYYEVSKILVMMSNVRNTVDMEKLESDVSSILMEYSNQDLSHIDTAKFVSSMFMMLQKNHLQLHSSITMLIRGICVIEATLEILNPNLNLVEVIMNYGLKEEMVFDSSRIADGAKKIVKSTKSMIQLPSEIHQFLQSFNRGEGKVKLEMSASSHQVDKLENLLHEFIIGLLDASLILAYSLERDLLVRRVLFYFIVILSIWLFIKMLIDHIHKGY